MKVKKISPDREIQLIHGDITEEKVDAIVNAANSYLKHGGAVAGAIVRKGGQIIQDESDKIKFVPVGQAALTSGGKLPAEFVIHAVGPRWGEGNEDEKLVNAVHNSLQLADKHKFQSISLPAISSGIFGFPLQRCANIIIQTVNKYLESFPDSHLKKVRICVIDEKSLAEFITHFSE
jgi:O-acetyl-ADP-ribose deacetylase (regulator of RNase III)